MTTATPPSTDAAATVAAADAADAAKTTRRLQIARGLTIAVAVLALVGAVLGAVLLGLVVALAAIAGERALRIVIRRERRHEAVA